MKNMVYHDNSQIRISAAGLVSGQPSMHGDISFVALDDSDSDGVVNAVTRGVFDLTVEARDSIGASAVVDGDIIYFDSADTPVLSKDNTGVRFGVVNSEGVTITAGGTGIIPIIIGL